MPNVVSGLYRGADAFLCASQFLFQILFITQINIISIEMYTINKVKGLPFSGCHKHYNIYISYSSQAATEEEGEDAPLRSSGTCGSLQKFVYLSTQSHSPCLCPWSIYMHWGVSKKRGLHGSGVRRRVRVYPSLGHTWKEYVSHRGL